MNSFTVNRYNVPTEGATSQTISIPHTGAGSSDTKTFGAFKDRTKVIFITVIDSGFNFTIDGSAPSTSASHRLLAGNQYYFNKELVEKAKFIKLAGATATGYMYASELTN
jgi:hypothetical protein